MEVSFIIPVLLHSEYLFNLTKASINNAIFHTSVSAEIIVIHNFASLMGDEMKKFLQSKNEDGVETQYIPHEKNESDAVCFNEGVRAAKGKYICYLNNDTLLQEGWYEPVKKILDDGEYKFATPCARQMYDRSYFEKYSQREVEWSNLPECLTGICMFQQKTIDELGPMDERFNFYSDRDYAKRADQLGIKVGMSTKGFATHISAMTWVGYKDLKNKEVFGWDPNEVIARDSKLLAEKYA